jgi:TolA-binding protein
VTKTVQQKGEATTVVVTTTPPAATSAPPSAPGGHGLNDRGFTRMQAGDFQGALPLLQPAVQKLRGTGPADPYEGFANYNLGYTLLKLGHCSEAVQFLARAQQLEPQRSEPGHALAQAKRC